MRWRTQECAAAEDRAALFAGHTRWRVQSVGCQLWGPWMTQWRNACVMAGAVLLGSSCAPAQGLMRSAGPRVSVGTAPARGARPQAFHDGKFGVRFQVPAGWDFSRKDRQMSTFHLDARSAPARAEMRGVASLQFNPFPDTVLSGATFYYSVERHTTDAECAQQASSSAEADLQDIGGMPFRHGHDEHGGICVEARDEVYTAYRKGACYRFDLEMNTFCAISSGAQELSERQIVAIEQRMTDILSTVVLDWEKAGANPVPAPAPTPLRPKAEPEAAPRHTPLVHSGE